MWRPSLALPAGVLWGQRCIKYGGDMKFVDERNNLTCEVEVDPQPHQSYISSWFRSKKSLGYKPDQVRPRDEALCALGEACAC